MNHTDLLNNNNLLWSQVVACTCAGSSNKVHNSASVDSTAAEIVDQFIKMNSGENDDVIDDSLYLYGCDFLTIAMLWMGYDSTRERALVYWKLISTLSDTEKKEETPELKHWISSYNFITTFPNEKQLNQFGPDSSYT